MTGSTKGIVSGVRLNIFAVQINLIPYTQKHAFITVLAVFVDNTTRSSSSRRVPFTEQASVRL